MLPSSHVAEDIKEWMYLNVILLAMLTVYIVEEQESPETMEGRE